MKKQTKAITLIALIFTIIVLLILAGVVINMTMGNEGIITKAQGAVDKYANTQEKENYEIAKMTNEIDNYVNGNRDTVTLTQEQYTGLLSAINKYPDYTNRREITFTNQSYTVEEDGYIQVWFSYSTPVSQVMDFVWINNTRVYEVYYDLTWTDAYTPLFLVKKGDVVRFQNTSPKVCGYYYNFR